MRAATVLAGLFLLGSSAFAADVQLKIAAKAPEVKPAVQAVQALSTRLTQECNFGLFLAP